MAIKRAQLNRHVKLASAHAALLLYTAFALFPVILVVINSLKTRRAIFTSPYTFPSPETWDPVGYQTVTKNANFTHYFVNSVNVTLISLLMILIAGAMAAY